MAGVNQAPLKFCRRRQRGTALLAPRRAIPLGGGSLPEGATMKDYVAEARRSALDRVQDDLDAALEAHSEDLGSPLEQAFLFGLVAQGIPLHSFCNYPEVVFAVEDGKVVVRDNPNGFAPRSTLLGMGQRYAWVAQLRIWSQVAIGPYRADFVMQAHRDGVDLATLVVELDGHDFHERTKEQARHDKTRDRYMAGLGLTVFRFAGSEVYADVRRCADQSLRYLVERFLPRTAPHTQEEIEAMEAAGI